MPGRVPDSRPPECPPSDAQPVNRTFLRFVSGELDVGSSPGSDDWLAPCDNPKSPYFGRLEDCACHAHSLLADPADVQIARQFVPAFRKKRVAEVAVRPDMGVVQHSPSRVGQSHHSWWPAPVDLVPVAVVLP